MLFKLESRTEATPEPFDKVRDAITAKIYESRMDGENEKFLERLRTQALIEWKDDSYKQMYEKARAAKTTGAGTSGPGPRPKAKDRPLLRRHALKFAWALGPGPWPCL